MGQNIYTPQPAPSSGSKGGSWKDFWAPVGVVLFGALMWAVWSYPIWKWSRRLWRCIDYYC